MAKALGGEKFAEKYADLLAEKLAKRISSRMLSLELWEWLCGQEMLNRWEPQEQRVPETLFDEVKKAIQRCEFLPDTVPPSFVRALYRSIQ